MEYIAVKSFHTLFSPIYVLDARLQHSGGTGPPKWELRSRFGVYHGQSPFHDGIVALVWNPTTGRVIPQYHAVFDNEFINARYIKSDTTQPKWDKFVK